MIKPGSEVLVTDAGIYSGDHATVCKIYNESVEINLTDFDIKIVLDIDQIRIVTKLEKALQ